MMIGLKSRETNKIFMFIGLLSRGDMVFVARVDDFSLTNVDYKTVLYCY